MTARHALARYSAVEGALERSLPSSYTTTRDTTS